MSDLTAVLLQGMYMGIGIAIGLSIGIAIGKKQKPWSEMTEEEKRMRKIAISAGIILLIIGVCINLWFFITY